MRRWWMLIGLILVACGGGGSSSPAADSAAATTTRSAEQTQVSGVLTPGASGSSVARSTTSVGSPPTLLGTPIPPSAGPIIGLPATVAPSVVTAPTALAGSPQVAATPAPTGPVVKVTADDGANVRDKPDTNGAVIGKADYGAELPVQDANVAGADGTSKWARISFEGKTGFIRSDLVVGPQPPSPPRPPTPTAAPGTAAAPAAPAASAAPTATKAP